MLHSGCVKMHQKFLDFVGLPMGLLREKPEKPHEYWTFWIKDR